MTRTHFNGPPLTLDEAGELCLVCLMVARGAELDATEAEWKRLEADGQDALQKWFPWDDTRAMIRPATVLGISDVLPGVGRVPLCWDHLAGLMVPKPARLDDGKRLPPGLKLRGRG